MKSREAYSPQMTADILGVTKSTVVRHIESGLIPAIRLGSRWLVPRSYVDKLFDQVGCPREVACSETCSR